MCGAYRVRVYIGLLYQTKLAYLHHFPKFLVGAGFAGVAARSDKLDIFSAETVLDYFRHLVLAEFAAGHAHLLVSQFHLEVVDLSCR